MTDEHAAEADDYILTLEGEDGTSHSCKIIDEIEFEGRHYVLFIKLAQGKENAPATPEEMDDEDELVIMQIINDPGKPPVFRTIESEEEFLRVRSYIEKLIREAVESDEDEEEEE